MRGLRLVAAACAFVALATAAQAERRVALVIGNDAYRELPVLKKAVADAESFAAVLEEKGYEVILRRDLTRQQMDGAAAAFIERIEPGDTAVFVYSGHGWSDGAQNFLVGTDAPKTGSQEFLARISIPLRNGVNGVLDEMERKGAGLKVAIIDACRDNPFVSSVAGRSIGLGRGLSRVEPPSGTFVVFSADAGQTALDRLSDADTAPNSVFTRSFLPLIRADRPLLDAIKTAQTNVNRLARAVSHDQRPAYYDAVLGTACLSERCRGIAVAPDDTPDESSPSTAIAADYALAAQIGTEAAWDAFLSKYADRPDDFYVKLAREARQKLAVGIAPPEPEPPVCEGGVIAKIADEPRCLRPGDAFRDCDQCPEMVVIQAGSFMMGSPENEAERSGDENPQHRVTIAAPFAVAKFEVTFDDWDACVAGGGCDGYRPDDAGWGRGDRPAIYVSWDDAKAYVAWLARSTGGDYRLLTEAEWEYAARAGATTPFSTGGAITTDQANFNGNYTYGGSREGVYREKTVAVGTFRANYFGLHDVHGNVWEWVEDCHHDSYNGAPSDGSAWTTGSCEYRVLRGGSWSSYPSNLRSANRSSNSSRVRYIFLGFRVARTLVNS